MTYFCLMLNFFTNSCLTPMRALFAIVAFLGELFYQLIILGYCGERVQPFAVIVYQHLGCFHVCIKDKHLFFCHIFPDKFYKPGRSVCYFNRFHGHLLPSLLVLGLRCHTLRHPQAS